MKLTVSELRSLVAEAKIGASKSYMQKEKIREKFQAIIQQLVSDGEIVSQQDLTDFFETSSMALNALKMVPIDVWQKMGGTATKKKR